MSNPNVQGPAWLKWIVDNLVAATNPSAFAGFVALLAALWLAVVVAGLGLLPPLRAPSPGPLPTAALAAPTPQQEQWIRELEDGQEPGELSELEGAGDLAKSWLRQTVCGTNFHTKEERQARAWRVRENPGLCDPLQRAVALAPMSVSFGPAGFLGLIVLIVLTGFAAWWPIRAVHGARRFYQRLYASEYHKDREARDRRLDAAADRAEYDDEDDEA